MMPRLLALAFLAGMVSEAAATHQYRCPEVPISFNPVIALTDDWPSSCRLIRVAIAGCDVITDPSACTQIEIGFFIEVSHCPVGDEPTDEGLAEANRQWNSLYSGVSCPRIRHTSGSQGGDTIVIKESGGGRGGRGGLNGAVILWAALIFLVRGRRG